MVLKASSEKYIVLYADDDEDDLELVSDTLLSIGKNIEIITKPDGHSAMNYLDGIAEDSEPCLIILDINMPKISGKDVLVYIRSNTRFTETPVILFTTSSDTNDKAFAEKYNAGFITKPLHVKQMENVAHQFLSHCSSDIQKNILR